MPYYNKFEKMKLADIRKEIKDLYQKANKVYRAQDEQTRELFQREEKRLQKIAGSHGRGGNLPTGWNLKKEEAIKFATELRRAVKLEEFTPEGGEAKKERAQKAFETFQKQHKGQYWNRQSWEELAQVFDTLAPDIQGALSSEQVVKEFITARRSLKKGKEKSRGESFVEQVNEAYKKRIDAGQPFNKDELLRMIRDLAYK